MYLEVSDQNISRSCILAAERKTVFHRWFSHFIFSKRNLKKYACFSDTFYLLQQQIPNPPPSALLPICSLSILSCPPPTCPFHSPPPLPDWSRCICSPEVAAAHTDESQWISGGTVSIGTWKERGSPCFPTHVFVVWPEWLVKDFCSSYDT